MKTYIKTQLNQGWNPDSKGFECGSDTSGATGVCVCVCARFSHSLSNSVEIKDYFRNRCEELALAGCHQHPVCLLSLCPSNTITATGRPWQPQTLMLSLRSSSPSSAVSKSRPSHKGKLLVYNRPRHDVRFCGLMVNEAHDGGAEVERPTAPVRVWWFLSVTVKISGRCLTGSVVKPLTFLTWPSALRLSWLL